MQTVLSSTSRAPATGRRCVCGRGEGGDRARQLAAARPTQRARFFSVGRRSRPAPQPALLSLSLAPSPHPPPRAPLPAPLPTHSSVRCQAAFGDIAKATGKAVAAAAAAVVLAVS